MSKHFHNWTAGGWTTDPSLEKHPAVVFRLQCAWIKEDLEGKRLKVFACNNLRTAQKKKKDSVGTELPSVKNPTSLHSCPIHKTRIRWKYSVTAYNDATFKSNTFFLLITKRWQRLIHHSRFQRPRLLGVNVADKAADCLRRNQTKPWAPPLCNGVKVGTCLVVVVVVFSNWKVN